MLFLGTANALACLAARHLDMLLPPACIVSCRSPFRRLARAKIFRLSRSPTSHRTKFEPPPFFIIQPARHRSFAGTARPFRCSACWAVIRQAGWCTRSQVDGKRDFVFPPPYKIRWNGSMKQNGSKKSGEISRSRSRRPSVALLAYRVLLDRDDYAFESITRTQMKRPSEPCRNRIRRGGVPTGWAPPEFRGGGANRSAPGANAWDGTGAIHTLAPRTSP